MLIFFDLLCVFASPIRNKESGSRDFCLFFVFVIGTYYIIGKLPQPTKEGNMAALVIDRDTLPERILSFIKFKSERVSFSDDGGCITLSPVVNPEDRTGNRRRLAVKSASKMNLDDILKLRGKYAGDISVESFLKQKREDIELEEKI